MTQAELLSAFHRAYIVDPQASPRQDDLRKLALVTALLPELRRLAPKGGGVLVDAACGRGVLGLLAALDTPQDRPWRVLGIERDPQRIDSARQAAARLGLDAVFTAADLSFPESWPQGPRLVVALHACGAATDLTLAQGVRVRAHSLLLLPCCYGGGQEHGHSAQPPDQAWALRQAQRLGLPEQSLVRGRFAQGLIDALRTLRLEAAGYRVEVLDAFAPAISPFNRLWRATWSGEPVRAARAEEKLRQMTDGHL